MADIATFCTSIIARKPDGEILHVRNLDFGYADVLKRLVYEAIYVKDGTEQAKVPLIAGFYGAYTGSKHNAFSISYNVRESGKIQTDEAIMEHLERNLKKDYVPQHTAVQNILLE